MSPSGKPSAEVIVNAPLVRALLQAQHPDLTDLPLTAADEGWDNALFRLGHNLAVRLPRRAIAATLVEREQQWLPRLAPRLPLPVPAPVRVGGPGCGYPWPWSITPWFEGHSALATGPRDLESTAVRLGEFLRALHHPAPPDAPLNRWRGVPLEARTASFLDYVDRLQPAFESARLRDAWNDAVSARPWSGPPIWIHGDLHPGNLIVNDGRVIAVVDFGDLTAGDPATDLALMWMLLPAQLHPSFTAAASGGAYATDDDMVRRARGWALSIAVAVIAAEGARTPLGARALRTLHAVLA